MTHARRIFELLFEIRPAGPGRPALADRLELFVLALVFVVALATPEARPDGAANAPGEELFRRWTGGGLCLYRRVTGIPCPGCGLSHGFVHLAHGNVAGAVAANPLTPVAFFVLAARLAGVAALVFSRHELKTRIPRSVALQLWGALALSALILGSWRIYAHVFAT